LVYYLTHQNHTIEDFYRFVKEPQAVLQKGFWNIYSECMLSNLLKPTYYVIIQVYTIKGLYLKQVWYKKLIELYVTVLNTY